jgi:hypothetical protein
MATALTTNLGLTTVEADDQVPEALTKDNFEILDQYVAATEMTNKSGAQVTAGDVVVADTTANNSFTTTTTASNPKVVGVVQETIANAAAGIVKHYGTSTVKVTGATSRGDWLRTSTTVGQADPVTSTNPPSGAFAIALSSSAGAGTVTAILLATATLGTLILPSSAAPATTTEGYIEWDSDDDVIVVGTGSAAKTIGMKTGAGLAATAAAPLAYDTTTGTFKVWDGSASVSVGPSGWKLAGSNTVEQTMTSATAGDLVTITGLTIPVTAAIMILTVFRKSAVAAQLSIGLKLNATVVAEADIASASGIGLTAATNEVQDGLSIVYIGPRSTNYLHGLTLEYTASGASGIQVGAKGAVVLTNAIPNATITDVIIRGDSDGSATLGVKEVFVLYL